MTDFIDPERFDNEDALLAYILEHVVKPRLKEILGSESLDDVEIGGMAYVFGTRQGNRASVLQRIQDIQNHVNEGLGLDYILAEMTDLHIVSQRDSEFHGMGLRYIELEAPDDDTEPLSSETLAMMFAASPSDG